MRLEGYGYGMVPCTLQTLLYAAMICPFSSGKGRARFRRVQAGGWVVQLPSRVAADDEES